MTTAMFITSNNKTPQSLRRQSCLHLLQCRNKGGLMTAHSGRVKGKTPMSINNRGSNLGLCDVMSHSQASQNGLIWVRGYCFRAIKKKHCVNIYLYRVVVFTHCKHTFVQATCKAAFPPKLPGTICPGKAFFPPRPWYLRFHRGLKYWEDKAKSLLT